ncbi:thiamine-phosphate kinase [soil metagenome]
MLGEFELISRLRERIAAGGADGSPHVVLGSGDDAAITHPPGVTATSVDAVVDGVHFRRSTFPPRAIGRKALAAALSDLAAMGATPGEIYVQAGLPGDIGEADVDGLADGMAEIASEAGAAIVGGDVVSSPVLFLAVAVVGHAASVGSLVTRAGAMPGDVVIVTGRLGGAAAGLCLLEEERLADAVDPSVGEELRKRQLAPAPRIAAGLALARVGASAMIDISDGVAADAVHLARASGVRIELDIGAAMIVPGVKAVAAATGREEIALAGGGEDYELLACVPAERADAALSAVRETTSDPAICGRVERGEGVVLRGPSGREASIEGFDQIRS